MLENPVGNLQIATVNVHQLHGGDSDHIYFLQGRLDKKGDPIDPHIFAKVHQTYGENTFEWVEGRWLQSAELGNPNNRHRVPL